MKQKKVLILLPDGVGLRNFAYTEFYKKALASQLKLVFWNNSSFDLKSLGIDEIIMRNAKIHPLNDIYKKARVQIDLNLNRRKFKDHVYDSYRFPAQTDSLANIIKYIAVRGLTLLHSSPKGIEKIRSAIFKFERRTDYYHSCLEVLKEEKPDFVFCTNQRTTLALAPILAAEDLHIPTGTFIFSWDNIPKATLVLEPNYYFVWSNHMKNELLSYYPFIKESQIKVTGTPQFEMHTDKEILLSKEVFFAEHNLDVSKRYICYSGDDITTSPNDAIYLEDTAKAIVELNKNGYQLGIIFRRCPVDFSDRFDHVLEKYQNVIVPINPKWEKTGNFWNNVLPRIEDFALQMNTIAHTEMVVNVGSSMVFDYATHHKACAFINYDVAHSIQSDWTVKKIYDYVHFRCMPTKDSVLWINSPEAIGAAVLQGLEQPGHTVKNARDWFAIVNQHPTHEACDRIIDALDNIIRTNKE
jgi:hypothetical protein